jgi:hypothetical protein
VALGALAVAGDPLQVEPELVRLLRRRHVRQLLFGEQARLDAHRELDLFGRVQQRHLADLLQVVLDRVGGGAGDLRRVDGDVVVIARGDDDGAGGSGSLKAGLVVPSSSSSSASSSAASFLPPFDASASASASSRVARVGVVLDLVFEIDVVIHLVVVGLLRTTGCLRGRLFAAAFLAGAFFAGAFFAAVSTTSSVVSVSSAVRYGWSSCRRSRLAFHRRRAPGFRTLVRPLSSPARLAEASLSRQRVGCPIVAYPSARTCAWLHCSRTPARAPAFRSAAPAPVVAVAPIGEEALEFGGQLIGTRQIARVDDRLRERRPGHVRVVPLLERAASQ